MKIFLLSSIFLLTFFANSARSDFVHPLDFDPQKHKDEVIKYIEDRVRKDYCENEVDMCQESTLRMMEKSNLEDFKKATLAKDRQIMDRVIKDYCDSGVDMCNYSTIWMMYQKNLEASKQKLSW
jgi:hypothetical protein